MKSLKVERQYLYETLQGQHEQSTKTVIVRDIIPNRFSFDQETVRNDLEARCQVLRGELKYNTSLGIVLGDNKEHMDLVISEIILGTQGVDKIESFSSTVDMAKRKYSANIVVNTVFNKTIEVII